MQEFDTLVTRSKSLSSERPPSSFDTPSSARPSSKSVGSRRRVDRVPVSCVATPTKLHRETKIAVDFDGTLMNSPIFFRLAQNHHRTRRLLHSKFDYGLFMGRFLCIYPFLRYYLHFWVLCIISGSGSPSGSAPPRPQKPGNV